LVPDGAWKLAKLPKQHELFAIQHCQQTAQ